MVKRRAKIRVARKDELWHRGEAAATDRIAGSGQNIARAQESNEQYSLAPVCSPRIALAVGLYPHRYVFRIARGDFDRFGVFAEWFEDRRVRPLQIPAVFDCH